MIQGKVKENIDAWILKYPKDQRQSAVMAALTIIQEKNGGYLSTELMDEVADYLRMPKISVYEVASFYSMYEDKPVGKNKICVCTNISCMLCGSNKIVEYLQQKLDIKMGEVTDDKMFSLQEVECLGACVNAPMMQIGKKYYENLTPEKIDKILEGIINDN